MRLALSIRPWQRLAFGFGFHFFAGHTWLGFEQLQLQGAQSFTLGPVFFDALLPQLFLKRLDFQARPVKLALQHGYVLLQIGVAHGGSSIISGKVARTKSRFYILLQKCFMQRDCAEASFYALLPV